MSLEESMKNLAEANERLATALTKYAETVDKYGLRIIEANGDGSAPAAAASTEKPKGGKGKAAASKEEPAASAGSNDGFGDDGFGGSGGGKTYTFDEVKQKLLDLMNKNGGDKTESVAIIGKYGYQSLNDIKDAHFTDIVNDVDKALAKK